MKEQTGSRQGIYLFADQDLEMSSPTSNVATIAQHELRAEFAARLSKMYAEEVPLYGELVRVVRSHNAEILERSEAFRDFSDGLNLTTLSAERHGAVRVATPAEMALMARLFNVLGMHPVGFYDLTEAPEGKRQPVLATAFRPVTGRDLERAPFRMFCSMLLPHDRRFFSEELGDRILRAVAHRRILSKALLPLIEKHETDGGLGSEDAQRFLDEAVKVFAWEKGRVVDRELYATLLEKAPIAADIILEPHLNHLTPRSLDIEDLHNRMGKIAVMKESIEGPPARKALVFLRQTSYRALPEEWEVPSSDGSHQVLIHRARFGEIEQRGVAMTSAGRELYDQAIREVTAGKDPNEAFSIIPDDHAILRANKLAYYAYDVGDNAAQTTEAPQTGPNDLSSLTAQGLIRYSPIRYEDFLPLSAAGIFGSNLDRNTESTGGADVHYQQAELESALERPILNADELYAAHQARTIARTYLKLGLSLPKELEAEIAEALNHASTGATSA